MQKVLGGLLACLLAVSAGVQAEVVANKTYFTSRSELHQRGREWAQTAHHMRGNGQSSKLGADISINGFFSRSTNQNRMGEYFGASDNANGSDVGSVQVVRSGATNALYTQDIDKGSSSTTGMAGKLTFAPTQDRYGATISYNQSLGIFKAKCLNGLSLSIDAPIVRVENDLGMAEGGQIKSTATGITAGKDTVTSFFAGQVEKTTAAVAQAKLKNGLLSQTPLKETTLGDLRVGLNYDFVNEKDCGVQVHTNLIVPFGNKTTGVNIWEAVVGNNNHLELGLGVKGFIDGWHGKNWDVRLSGGVEYTYSFLNQEKRMVGVYDTEKKVISPWGHAPLAVQNGKTGTFPLANVLVHDVNVTPGSLFEATLGATVSFNNFFVNVGYNGYYRQKESVAMQEGSWSNDKYGVAPWSYDASVAADFSKTNTSGLTDTNGGAIQQPGKVTSSFEGIAYHDGVSYEKDENGDDKKDSNGDKIPVMSATPASRNFLTTETCATPDQETHTFLLSGGYNRKIKNFPVGVVVGGSYEIAADQRKALQGWAVYGRISVGF